MLKQKIQVNPLYPSNFFAEVIGADLRNHGDDMQFDAIKALIYAI